ncbi:hypothetical protein Jann_2027 [Jannaschia sp. CCS1]|nr:hypothetical protein Jann_2027 [Jannaschia sp. CCS1]
MTLSETQQSSAKMTTPHTRKASIELTTDNTQLLAKRMRQTAYVFAIISLIIQFRWIIIPRDYLYLVDVASEVNFWTWLNVTYMLFAAQVLALSAWLRSRKKLPAVGLGFASLALVLLSMDDFMSFHERLGPLGVELGGGDGFFKFAWVIPGSIAALIILMVFLNAARSTEPSVRRDTLTGVALLFGGAIGVEMVSGAVLAEIGYRRLYILLYHFEEILEAVGIVFIARAGLRDILSVSSPPT